MKKELWEAVVTYVFAITAILLYLGGLVVQLMLKIIPPAIVAANHVIPTFVAFTAYLLNRRFLLFNRLCEWVKEVKLLCLWLPIALITFAVVKSDALFMEVYFPIWAILAMALMPSIFKENVESALAGIVLSAFAFAWTELLLGDGISGLLTTFFAALLLTMGTVNADSFTDKNKPVKAVVAGTLLISGFTIILLTPTGLFALLKTACTYENDFIRENALIAVQTMQESVVPIPNLVAAENVLIFLIGEFGKIALLLVFALVLVFATSGGMLAFANRTHTRFFAVGVWAFMSLQMVSYLAFSFGYDTIFPLWCPLLDVKQAPMNTLIWLLVFSILPPHHLHRFGGRYDNSRPVWDFDEYIVTHMSFEELIQALGDEDYVSYAWKRLTEGEFRLTGEQRKSMLDVLPINRYCAKLLTNYVLNNPVSFCYWERLLIVYSEFLSEEEFSVIIDRYNQIYGEVVHLEVK